MVMKDVFRPLRSQSKCFRVVTSQDLHANNGLRYAARFPDDFGCNRGTLPCLTRNGTAPFLRATILRNQAELELQGVIGYKCHN